MPAANTDKFRKSAARKSTTTSASMSADSDASIACSSLSGWPTDTAVSVVFNRVDGDGTLQNNWETATAVVSANNLTNMVRGVEGAAAAWPSGTVVELIWTADNVNDMVDGITAEHNQDGTHSAVTATTVATTGVITAGSHIDINDSSTAIRDSSDNELVKFSKTASAVNELTIANAATTGAPSISATGGDTNVDLELTPKGTGNLTVGGNTVMTGAWQDWTPSYSSVTVGNGTVVAKYCQIGKTIHFVWTLDIGSTTVIGNNITISAPVTASAYFNNGFVPIGNASAEDSGTSHSFGFVYFDESATNMLCRWNDGTGNSTSVFPITEAAGDHFAISGAYEAA
jgi:hypothetical protein